VGVGSGALFGGLGNEKQSDITWKNNVRANRSLAIECHPLSENNTHSHFCRLHMPDEVAALPSPASTFQTHFRAAARPDLRPPQASFPTTSNARTKQSSGSALVCSDAPTAAPPVISNRSHISTFPITFRPPDYAYKNAERQR
jgi:hypothetical protein